MENASDIDDGFIIKGAPAITMRFISTDQKADVAVRVFCMITEKQRVCWK